VNGPVPLGLTDKVALAPAFKVCVVAVVVTVGGSITVKIASLKMLPYGVVAVTRYVPPSATVVEAIVKVAPVWLARVVPFRVH
jgi:hypothetical protein